jgi:phospholipid/cholesterol/gamma-HCH transport system ATP-binding protein
LILHPNADSFRAFPWPKAHGVVPKRRALCAGRAIALNPEILVFDEPSAGLDPIVSAGLDELILFLKRGLHMTILVVTHELESAFASPTGWPCVTEEA